MWSSWTNAVILLCSIQVFALPQAGCQKASRGIQWAYYNNTAADSKTGYSTFVPSSFKTTKPVAFGLTPNIGGSYEVPNNPQISIYGSPATFNRDSFALNHRGYLLAPSTGSYYWTFAGVDDIAILWTGENAYTSWTRGDADCTAAYNVSSEQSGACTYTATYTKGQYVPFRVLYGHTFAPATMSVTITGPGGAVLLDSSNGLSAGYSANFVQYGCGSYASAAPLFPNFGSE